MNKKIVRAGYEGYFEKNVMRVNINVQDMCNFTCSYCINGASKNKMKRQLSKQCLSYFIDDLKSRNSDENLFSIAGGEPLLYPHIEFLVDKIDNNFEEKTIYFATNGALLHKKGNFLYSSARNTKLKFLVSIHIEQINVDEFSKNIINFGHYEDIKCKILFTPGMLKESKKIISLFQKNNIACIISVVTNPGGIPYTYSDEEIKFLQETETSKIIDITHTYDDGEVEDIDRITRGLQPEKMNYKGMFCAAGINALRLAPDGTCSRCFGFLRKGEKFDLNVRRLRDITELTQPCICPVDFCTCLTFLQTPKWRDYIYTPEWLD